MKIRNRDLSYKFKKVGFLRNYLKRSKLALRLKTRKIFLVTNFSTKNAKVLNWSPYFSRYRKHSTLSQFLMLSNIITFLKKDAFITTIVDDSAAPKFLGSRLLLTKMLKIFRKSQFFCIIKITSTNVFFTITNGCGEVKLCCSAGQVGFIKRKTRKKSLVFVKMIDYIIFKLGLNLLSKLDRLSFINTPKFLVYKIIAEFIARGIALNKV